MLAAGIATISQHPLADPDVGPLLGDSITDPGDLRLLGMMGKSAERGAGLVRQILSFAHRTYGEVEALQVKHVIRELSNVILQTFTKSIKYEEKITSDLWLIEGNPIQFIRCCSTSA